jgi:nitroreductase
MTPLSDLVLRNRSFRRFDASHPISRATLLELADLARQTASAANRQPLKYLLSHDPDRNAAIFPHLAWAGYLKDWDGPAPGERPSAYIVILVDQRIAKEWWCDDGIAAQTMLLEATRRGLGGCMIGAIQKEKLRRALHIPDHFLIRLVLALGKPAEQVVLEPLGADGDIRYWRDDRGVHHVPKRSLEEVVIG